MRSSAVGRAVMPRRPSTSQASATGSRRFSIRVGLARDRTRHFRDQRQSEVRAMNEVVVCGAGGFIGGHLVADLFREGGTRVRAVDVKPIDEWFQVFGEADNRVADLSDREACRRRVEGRTRRLQPGRGHGRDGLHREQQGASACCPCSSTRTCFWPLANTGRAILLRLVRMRLRGRQADVGGRRCPEGSGCLSGDAGGRLRLGEALQ